MLKISIVETPTRLRLVLEGKLVAPWIAELRRTWAAVQAHLHGRRALIDFRNVTVISQEGENILLQLMIDGANFTCNGVFNQQVLANLTRRCKSSRPPSPLPKCVDE